MSSLGAGTGKAYWRSLNELADTPEFRKMVEDEFPSRLDELVDPLSRRRFVQVMGASLALAGLTGCDLIRWPKEKILPFARRPEGRDPGTAVHYATAIELGGVGAGLLVTSYDGRPIKIEGNERHPESLGATSGLAQASVLGLYDPDRSRTVRKKGSDSPSSWAEFEKEVGPKLIERVANRGDKLAILCEATSSPTVARLRAELEKRAPRLRWFEYEPVSRDNEHTGVAGKVLGGRFRTHFNLRKADVVVSLDACLLEEHPAALRHAREFAQRRKRVDRDRSSNRLYCVESSWSITGGMADQRLALQAGEVLHFGLALAAEIVSHESLAGKTTAPLKEKLVSFKAGDTARGKLARTIAKDLLELERRGRSVVAVGPRQPAVLHALAHLLNGLLGNVGETVSYTSEPARPSSVESIRTLVQEIDQIDTLLILGSNPVFTAPADLDFAKVLERVQLSIHMGLYHDETGKQCTWHLPRSHYLESWGDTRAYDGTTSLVQPLIRPLFGSHSVVELLAFLSGVPLERSHGYELVRRTYREEWKGKGDFEKLWRRALHSGVVVGSEHTPEQPARKDGPLLKELQSVPAKPKVATKEALELVFRADRKVYDGRFANNGWLQELPDPFTKLTWDNAVWMSPATAEALGGVKEGDLVTLKAELGGKARTLEVAAFVVPGLADFSLSLSLGYGRTDGGVVAKGAGFNAYVLRTSSAMDFVGGFSATKANKAYMLATTQDHHSVSTPVSDKEKLKRSGELIREGTLGLLKKQPMFAKNVWEGGKVHGMGPDPQKTLLWKEPHNYNGRKWGMAIDLSVCTGCSACVVACQAENNIPVVGKSEVQRGREMHWLRIDRYFTTNHLDAEYHTHAEGEEHEKLPPAPLRVVHQPMPCQQCENAPCEAVCPVAATTHTIEGLNDMVYNRCIGTRYCGNNCPYKVRRFNYFYNHHGPFHPRSSSPHAELPVLPAGSPVAVGGLPAAGELSPLQKMAFNPEVSVRARGVMEKCTYCTQRIKAATIPADNEKRKVHDGEIQTACQQVCPTQAIVFGNLNDKESEVARLHKSDRTYGILTELNTRPRTQYMAKIRNPAVDA